MYELQHFVLKLKVRNHLGSFYIHFDGVYRQKHEIEICVNVPKYLDMMDGWILQCMPVFHWATTVVDNC